jgi:hypothetical protein
MKARLKLVLKLVATCILLGWLLSVLDVEQLVETITRVDGLCLSGGILVSATFALSRVLKWQVLTRENGLFAPHKLMARLMLSSLALGIITPGRVGEVVCVAPFPKESRARAVVLYLMDRFGELAMVLMFAVPGIAIYFQGYGPLAAFGVVLLVIAILIPVQSITARRLLLRVLMLDRIEKVRQLLHSQLRVPQLYWSLCIFSYLQAYALICFFIAGSVDVSDWGMVLLLPFITLSNLISITVGGLGVREGLAAVVLPLADVPAETAAAAFFLSFIFTRVLPGLIGLVWGGFGFLKSN